MKTSENASAEWSAAAPLVSCIVPTRGRPEWVPQAIRYFKSQDYPNLELIIVDTTPGGPPPPTDDARIRFHRAPAHATIGAIRNIACGLAHGEIVVQWDDDDWYAAGRVSAQVQPILEGRADITGLADTLFFDLDRWLFWRCESALFRRMFVLGVHGGTLAFRRSVFEAGCRYPDASLAEDAAFLRAAVDRGARLLPVPGEGLFVYLRHAGNAWSFACGTFLDPAGWWNESEPPAWTADRDFYAARSQTRRLPATAAARHFVGRVAIGVHVHAEPHRLAATLAALDVTTPGFQLLLMPDGPEDELRPMLRSLAHVAQSPTDVPAGAPACFNRLARETTAETLILVESGVIVGPGWLEALLAALAADPRHGLASPSTNRAWNQLCAFPKGREDDADIARTAAEAARRFANSWRSLTPLWDVADFCLAVRRDVVEAVGPADEAYGQGPCWEMDYAIRAARAGFEAVWARSAYVYRHPATARRQREEGQRFEASRRRYQDKFCGLRLSGARTGYHKHCRGEDCEYFAPPIAEIGAQRAAVTVSESPLASCIMPTADRRRFVPDAIARFLAQDYPARELIILDDGDEPVEDLVPSHPSVRYIRIARQRSLGLKRNAACEAARGEIILHWDDDDWYAPHRVRTQVDALLSSGADVCGLDRVLFFDPSRPAGWEYVYPRGGTPWVAGATLCYRRAYWQAHPFADITIGEDNLFAAAARPGQLHILPDNRFFVALVHAANTSRKQVADPRWQPREVATLRALTGPDWPPPEISPDASPREGANADVL